MATLFFTKAMPAKMNLIFFVLVMLFVPSNCVPPHLVPVRLPDNLEENQRLAVTCTVAKGSPPIAFTWRKDGEPLHQSSDLKLVHNDDYQETLQIIKLSGVHVGNYTCAVKNAFGADQMSVGIVFKFKPQWKTSPNGSGDVVTTVAGTSVELDCVATGHPSPTLRVYSGTCCNLRQYFKP